MRREFFVPSAPREQCMNAESIRFTTINAALVVLAAAQQSQISSMMGRLLLLVVLDNLFLHVPESIVKCRN
jgi:hypothetical protein